MTGAELLAATALVALVAYVLLAGADFGGGVWDLLATGPRAREQRRLVEQALAPVWEANHVWLIVLVVILFTGFPPAFAVISTALHIPLMLVLLGIVLRGSAFVFRQYGGQEDRAALRWGRVFAVASVVTPVFLGVTLGAITAEGIRVGPDGVPTTGFVAPWLGAFPFSVGLLALAAFAFLAATYLTVEAEDEALRDDFRRRALLAGGATALAAALAGGLAWRGAPRFFGALTGSTWSLPVLLGTAAVLGGALEALRRRAFRPARVLAAAAVGLVVVGWGLAQRPYVVAPDLTVAAAAAPPHVVRLTLWLLLVALIVVGPSLYVLLRVFKAQGAVTQREAAEAPSVAPPIERPREDSAP
ncbi:MAG: cytochrome d ubiquinol oxidase subunit II [Planctomycetes bacterium]|nr:cytochrome d ubiquinol oxidase subunit II [Planctomycetota bacterium]